MAKVLSPELANRGLRSFWAISLCCLIPPVVILAQERAGQIEAWKEIGVPYLNNYTPKEYGESPQNWAVVQDDRGIVYVANLNGVLEFDGIFWRQIEMPRQRWALSLARDSAGTIFVGSFGDFGYLAPDSLGQMQFVSLLEHIAPEDRDFAEVWRIHCISDGVYFWTRNRLFRWSNHQIKIWESASNFSLSSAANDTLYVEESGTGLLKMIDDSLRVISASKPLSPMRIIAMSPYDRGRMLVFTMQGLLLFDGRTFSPFESEANAFIRENNLSNAVALPDGGFAVATYGGGVCFIDREGRIIRMLDKIAGLLSQDVKNLYCDRQGALWMALSSGLAYVRAHDPFSFFTAAHGLEGSVVSIVRHQGSLYVATSQGIFRLITAARRSTFTPPRFERVAGVSEQGFWLLSAGQKLLAAASGVYQIEGDKAALVDAGQQVAFVLQRSLQDTNRIYVGLQRGLEILRRENETWMNTGLVKGIHEEIRTIVEENDGTLWLGTIFQGVLRVRVTSREADGWKANITHFGKSHGLPDGPANISRIKGELVFATEKGHWRFDEAQQAFLPYSTIAAELADTTRPAPLVNEDRFGQVFAFVINEKGTPELWLARPQESGSYRLDKQRLRALANFGLPHSTFTDADGVIWIGCSSGLVRYDSKIAKDYTAAYPAVIRRMATIRGDSVIYGGAVGAKFNPVVLPHRYNSLHFEFALPFFEEAGENRYQYELDGFDEEWSEWTREMKKDYTNLPEGVYNFRVRGRTIYEQLSDEANFTFQILPPWYRSWWAYLLYAVLGVGMVATIVKMRVHQLERKTAGLEAIVAERTGTIREQAEKLKELDQMKSRFFANISHEFRTPLTLILGPLEDVIARVKDKTVKEELRMMERNAGRLLRLINQLLDLSRLESGRMTLHASRGDFIAFLKGIVMSFASLAEQKKITLGFETDAALANGLPFAIYFDRDKIEKIFYNLLSNAFKFTPEGGTVVVNCEIRIADSRTISSAANRNPQSAIPDLGREYVEIRVKDTGIGIPADRLPHVFDRFYQVDDTHTRKHEGSGLGLALTKELVERHYGEIAAHSTEAKGSEFIVRVPLGKEHLQPEEIVESSEQLPVVSDQLSVISERASEKGQAASERDTSIPAIQQSSTPSIQPSASDDLPLILVVDDHPDVRSYIRKHLEPDYQVTEAKDGQDGVDLARETVPDLVISDVMMPKLDGYQLCEALKTNEKTSHIPVILLTAKAGEENKLAGLETGADDYLVKPFNSRELQVRARNLIALRRKLAEHFRREGLLQPHEIKVPSVEEAFLQKLMQATEQHLGEEEFDLEVLRNELNMGQKQLYRKIKALTGQTPTEFIRTIRLRRAKQLLAQHAGTISEIAFQVGFNNLSYFSKCFREEFGQLPSELAKS